MRLEQSRRSPDHRDPGGRVRRRHGASPASMRFRPLTLHEIIRVVDDSQLSSTDVGRPLSASATTRYIYP